MNTIIVIGSVSLLLLVLLVIITVVGEVSTTKRYRKKLADFDQRSMMQDQGNETLYSGRESDKLSLERKSVFSENEHTPVA